MEWVSWRWNLSTLLPTHGVLENGYETFHWDWPYKKGSPIADAMVFSREELS